tara:strand:- start:51 stop:302 length:252 start_codon:yes stop_codon:yes gene_type:complete
MIEEKFITSPIKFASTGWTDATEEEAEMWSNYHYTTRPRYGEGWFPAYEFHGPHNNYARYMYRSRQEAEAAMSAYIEEQKEEA